MRIEHDDGKVTRLMPPSMKHGRHNCYYVRMRSELAHNIAHATFMAISEDDKQCTKFHTEFTKQMDKKGWALMKQCHSASPMLELVPHEKAEKQDSLSAARDEVGSFLVQPDTVEETKAVEQVQAEPKVESSPVWKTAGYWQ